MLRINMKKIRNKDLVRIISGSEDKSRNSLIRKHIKKAILLKENFKIIDTGESCGRPIYSLKNFPFFIYGDDLILADFDDGGL